MTDLGMLLARTKWGGRSETPEQITARLLSTFEAFALFGGVLAQGWVDPSAPDRVVSGPGPELLHTVREGVDTNRAGETSPRYGYYAFLRTVTPEHWWPYESPPVHATLTVKAGNEFGNEFNAVNYLFIKFEGDHPYEVEVLPRAAELIHELVTIWEPDHASLDSQNLMLTYGRAQRNSIPIVGFATWLSDRVAGELGDVAVHHRERFRDGTLLSMDLGSPTLLEDTVALSSELNSRGLIHPVPTNQSDPPIG